MVTVVANAGRATRWKKKDMYVNVFPTAHIPKLSRRLSIAQPMLTVSIGKLTSASMKCELSLLIDFIYNAK